MSTKPRGDGAPDDDAFEGALDEPLEDPTEDPLDAALETDAAVDVKRVGARAKDARAKDARANGVRAKGEPKGKRPPPPSSAKIVDDGPHHVVYLKPPGMTVVGGRGVPRPTLLDLAVERFPGARPVHRLDRVTTGLCVIAKTMFGQQALSEAFRRHFVDKRYLAVVEGTPPWEKIDIDARLLRIDDADAHFGHKKGPLAIQTISDEGIRALTRVKVIARGDGVTLVEARPETGRMHQIRCHLAHTGHPIVGDSMYGAKTAFVDGAVALLAFLISFPAPQGARRFVACPLPDDFKSYLQKHGIDPAAPLPLAERFVKVGPAKAPPAPPPRSSTPPRPGSKPAPKAGAGGKAGKAAPSKATRLGGRDPRGRPAASSDRGRHPEAKSAQSDRGRPGGRRGR